VKRLETRKRAPIAVRVARLLRSFALLLGAGGVVVLGMQTIDWFRDGIWPSWVLLDLWLWLGHSYSISAASRADHITLLILDLPLGPMLLAAALVLLIVGRAIEKPRSSGA
jgi:hypothetical protein